MKQIVSKNEQQIARKAILIINTESFFIFYSKFPTISTFISHFQFNSLNQVN